MLNLTNEIVNLAASVTTFVFPIGIAIFVFEFKNMKDALEKNRESKIESVIMPKLERLIRKTNRLFISGTITIFYAISVKIVISQFINPFNFFILWLMLIGAIILLIFTFFFLRSILYEISLTHK